jgi:hypothetical protein
MQKKTNNHFLHLEIKMKNFFSFLLLSVGLLTAPHIMAQKPLTSETATASIGYTIVDRSEAITIYKYVPVPGSIREAEKYVPKYFFTTTASNVLQPMTKTNLKKAFPNKQPFASTWVVSSNK